MQLSLRFSCLWLFVALVTVEVLAGDTDGATSIVIKLKEGGTQEDVNTIMQRHPQYVIDKQFEIAGQVYYQLKIDNSKILSPLPILRLGTGGSTTPTEIGDEEQVEFSEVQTKTTFHLFKAKPITDPELSGLWHLNNDLKYSMNIAAVWADGYTGAGVTVAIVDTFIQTNHTDLGNMDVDNSYDFYNDDSDPNPDDPTISHGTMVAGIVGATYGNDFCTVGVAYNATLVAIGLLGETQESIDLSDAQVGRALAHYSSDVSIYVNSWGPDTTSDFHPAGSLAKTALVSLATNGRQGNGSIFVFAAGNGGSDSNANAYLQSSIYAISVASVEFDAVSPSAGFGANIMTSAYGGGVHYKALKSTVPYDECSETAGVGSSFAAPVAAGVIALMLEANNGLTWRDVQHIIIRGSNARGFKDEETKWRRNKYGFMFNRKMGFGLLDAKEVVGLAKKWKTVPEQISCTVLGPIGVNENVTSEASGKSAIRVGLKDCGMRYLEHVLVTVNVRYSAFRGTVELELISPGGTRIQVQNERYNDAVASPEEGSFEYTYKVLHLWGESPQGLWKLMYKSVNPFVEVGLDSWSLELYGTKKSPGPK
ncbi:furin-like protease 1, isoforms 1/1-X/2 isoform X2 [Mytilus trossulus]